MSEIFIKLAGENPKITAGATIGIYGLMIKYLVFDPYKNCTAVMTFISAAFTIAVCAVFPIWISLIDFKDAMDWGAAWLLKMVSMAGSAMTVYALYKKTNRNARRRNIRRKKTATK